MTLISITAFAVVIAIVVGFMLRDARRELEQRATDRDTFETD